VTFLGSSGLGVLVQARQDLAELGRHLVIRGAPPPIRRTFEITKLDQVFEVEEPAEPSEPA
jgi:anti-anti-sigma factor